MNLFDEILMREAIKEANKSNFVQFDCSSIQQPFG